MKLILAIALTAILSLSMFAHVFAKEESKSNGDDSKPEKDTNKDDNNNNHGTFHVTSTNNEEQQQIIHKGKPHIDCAERPGFKVVSASPKCIYKPIDDNNSNNKPPKSSCEKPKVLLSNGDCVDSHTDRPDSDCAFSPGLGKCAADCTSNHEFCECPSGFVMNENDHCTPDKPCPKGFEQHADDETSTCFPTAKTLRGHPDTRPINIRIHSHVSASATATATATATAPLIISPTVPNGLNATFFDPTTPYCWYVVNAPPCFDVINNTIIH